MRQILKNYNKDALKHNLRSADITYQIIRDQIKSDGYKIIDNKSWSEWYLVPLKLTHPSRPDHGFFNFCSDIGRHSSEHNLLKFYLENRM